MKNVLNITNITKDIFTKACIYFSVMILSMNIIGIFLSATSFAQNILGVFHLHDQFAQNFIFIFMLASVFAGGAVQVFKIKKLPVFSRHIAFFILLYLIFLLVIVPFGNYSVNQGTTLLLSVAFIVIYFVVFGMTAGIKAIINSAKNKNLKYEKQFKDAE